MTARRRSIYSIVTLAILLASAAVSSVVYSLPQKNIDANGVIEVEEANAHDVDTNIITQPRPRKMKTLSNKPPDTTKIAAAGKPRAAITTADLLPVKHRRAKSSKRGKRSKKINKSKHNLFNNEDCNMDVFKGQYYYTNGCGGKSYAVDVSCDLDSSDKHQQCVYEEHSMDNECKFMSHPFKSRKYVKDEYGNCILGLPHPVPLEIVNLGEECGAHPSLSVKVVAMKEEDGYDSSKLQVYFSEDYGDTYYNEGNPHVATPRRDRKRMLLDKKGSDDEDEVEDYTVVPSSSQLHLVGDRELLAFHEKTQRKLCEAYDPTSPFHECWKVYGKNEWCYTTVYGNRPQGPFSPDWSNPVPGESWVCKLRECEEDESYEWVCKSSDYCNDDNGKPAEKCSPTEKFETWLTCFKDGG